MNLQTRELDFGPREVYFEAVDKVALCFSEHFGFAD
jgi:hypothetical protein